MTRSGRGHGIHACATDHPATHARTTTDATPSIPTPTRGHSSISSTGERGRTHQFRLPAGRSGPRCGTATRRRVRRLSRRTPPDAATGRPTSSSSHHASTRAVRRLTPTGSDRPYGARRVRPTHSWPHRVTKNPPRPSGSSRVETAYGWSGVREPRLKCPFPISGAASRASSEPPLAAPHARRWSPGRRCRHHRAPLPDHAALPW